LPIDVRVWVSFESRFDFKLGERIYLTGSSITSAGDRGVVTFSDGSTLAVALEGTLEEGTPVSRPAGASGADGPPLPPPLLSPPRQDLRALPIRYDASGSRYDDWRRVLDDLTETPQVGWSIAGPRTTLWLAKAIRSSGFTPTQRHFWWRSILNLTAGEMGVDEHHFLSEALERAAVFDQLNISELEAFEAIARRYQMWEEIYASALKQAEVGVDHGDWLDERRIFLGAEKSKGHALVCPALEQHVATKLAAESAVLKERRKAREERTLAAGEAPAAGAADPPKSGRRARGRGR